MAVEQGQVYLGRYDISLGTKTLLTKTFSIILYGSVSCA